MIKRIVEREHLDDETEEFYLELENGKIVNLGIFTHSEYGWCGMDLARELISDFAEALKIEIEIEEYENVE